MFQVAYSMVKLFKIISECIFFYVFHQYNNYFFNFNKYLLYKINNAKKLIILHYRCLIIVFKYFELDSLRFNIWYLLWWLICITPCMRKGWFQRAVLLLLYSKDLLILLWFYYDIFKIALWSRLTSVQCRF